MNACLNLPRILAIVCSGALLGASPNIWADLEVGVGVQINSVDDFYQPLASDGAWITLDNYGRCWHPTQVSQDWRPYCNGEWVWTDSGWYWQSDEPWAWACYHYGSWVDNSTYGWCWVPGVDWAPAWVVWRTGGGHIGWAPCGPEGREAAPSAYVFVDDSHFTDHQSPSTVVVNNPAFIKNTQTINEVSRETRSIDGRQQAIMVNRGPPVATVEKAVGQRFTPLPIQDAARRTTAPDIMKQPVHQADTQSPALQNQPLQHLSDQSESQSFQPPVRPSDIPNRPVLPEQPSPPVERPLNPSVPPEEIPTPSPRPPDNMAPPSGPAHLMPSAGNPPEPFHPLPPGPSQMGGNKMPLGPTHPNSPGGPAHAGPSQAPAPKQPPEKPQDKDKNNPP